MLVTYIVGPKMFLMNFYINFREQAETEFKAVLKIARVSYFSDVHFWFLHCPFYCAILHS